MLTRITLSAAAALALATTPVLAQASLAERLPAPVEEGEELAGGTLFIALLAAAAAIAGIAILTDDDDDAPVSP